MVASYDLKKVSHPVCISLQTNVQQVILRLIDLVQGSFRHIHLSGNNIHTDSTATLDNDTIHFEDFPIRDIVFAIVQDETTADQIVEAVGQVGYAIGYEPTLAAEKDTVTFVLDPKPLTLAVQLPSDTEEEAQTLQIEVKVEAGAEGTYDVESEHIVFNFSATEVLLDEGEEQTPLEGFDGINLQFDMNQSKTKAHWL